MKTFSLFIGSNNDLHKVETAKIKKIVCENHDGSTLLPCTGYWLGKPEKSVQVVICDDENKILKTAGKLKIALKQDAIALVEMPAMLFV